MTEVRKATLNDAERILEIYGYYVKNTAVSFEYDVPSISEFKKRMSGIMQKYPYLVAVRNGRVEGFAYASTFNERSAYDRSCELTIYLDSRNRGLGMGRYLYGALEDELKKRGFLNLYALIAYTETDDEYLTAASAAFHLHIGFKKVGELHRCGHKFGRWYDVIWAEKIIGEHQTPADDLI